MEKNMKISTERQIKNIDGRIKQYIDLIIKTIFDICELLEKKRDLLKNGEK